MCRGPMGGLTRYNSGCRVPGCLSQVPGPDVGLDCREDSMRQRLLFGVIFVATALGAAASGQAPTKARRPRGAPRAVHRVHARQRAARHPASRRERARCLGQRLVSRRIGQREAGTHRVRAPVRAPDVRRLEERPRRRVRHTGSRPPAATTTDRRTTIGPTTSSTSRRTRSTWRCFSNRIGWATCSTR